MSIVRGSLKPIFSNLVWIFVAGYFVYHIIIGARGIISWAILSKELEHLEFETNAIKKNNEFLTDKVQGMRSESLDLDLLEEQAEKILGFAHADDEIILLPKA